MLATRPLTLPEPELCAIRGNDIAWCFRTDDRAKPCRPSTSSPKPFASMTKRGPPSRQASGAEKLERVGLPQRSLSAALTPTSYRVGKDTVVTHGHRAAPRLSEWRMNQTARAGCNDASAPRSLTLAKSLGAGRRMGLLRITHESGLWLD